MPIQVLPAQLVSQIAAGEVVERPASVIKELLENSLDAGASRIDIDLEEGGLRLMRVRDNGQGISESELPLALARHATSKIGSQTDLDGIVSLGFRGEALPSIAAVSRLTLSSRLHDEAASAWIVSGDGGDDLATPKPVAHAPGTTVEVRDLFHAIPARRKFLRTERTELRHIEQVVRRIALSRPEVEIRLTHNGRPLLSLLPDASGERRVTDLCGAGFMAQALPVNHEAAGMGLSGWLAQPGFSRSQPDLQYFYVNGRMVRDKLLQSALRRAYADVLHNQRHPAFVLFLQLDPRQVDVNAHPSKHELRFRESRLVYDFVFHAVRAAIADERPQETAAQHRVELEPVLGQPSVQPRFPERGYTTADQSSLGLAMAESTAPDFARGSEISTVTAASAGIPPLGLAVAQLHDIYILAQNAEGLVLVDMHAAHERILYERLKQAQHSGPVATQPLLLPVTLQVSEQEATLVEEHGAELCETGLLLERSGPQTVVLRGLPALLGREVDAERLVRDAMADLQAQDGRPGDGLRELQDALLGNMACKSAIKAGRRLTPDEMNRLLRDMEHTERAGMCNHGRPTWVQLELNALDRLFMRGQ